MPVKTIAGLAPLGQSLALAGEGFKMAKKAGKKGLNGMKNILGGFTKIIVGVPLMKATSIEVGKL